MRVFAPIINQRRRLKHPVMGKSAGQFVILRFYDGRPWGFGLVRVTGSPGSLTHGGYTLNLATGEITKEPNHGKSKA